LHLLVQMLEIEAKDIDETEYSCVSINDDNLEIEQE